MIEDTIYYTNEEVFNASVEYFEGDELAAKVFDGDKWETKDQNRVLDEIINSTNNLLEKWMKSDKKRRQRYEQSFIEYMQQEGKKTFDEETKNELKLLLYDSYKNGTVDIKSVSKPVFNENDYIEDEESDNI